VNATLQARFSRGLPWPDYPNDTIILTPEFLKALRDGEQVTLTFHVYSGAKLM
jgi:hypothetical protein